MTNTNKQRMNGGIGIGGISGGSKVYRPTLFAELPNRKP
jgi:hypothetical protein